jgi:hypothetical protein
MRWSFGAACPLVILGPKTAQDQQSINTPTLLSLLLSEFPLLIHLVSTFTAIRCSESAAFRSLPLLQFTNIRYSNLHLHSNSHPYYNIGCLLHTKFWLNPTFSTILLPMDFDSTRSIFIVHHLLIPTVGRLLILTVRHLHRHPTLKVWILILTVHI